MRRLISLTTAAAAAFALGACASIPPARMALPQSLTSGAEQVSVTGMGGGQRGSFVADQHSGTFVRSETRLAFFDPLYERRDGSTSFSVRGPAISGEIDLSCRMRERTVTLGLFSVEAEPTAYRCDFTHEGRAIPARFELQAHREGLGGMMMREERRGEIALDRAVLQIRSVHNLQGSPFQLATPIGYVFESDGVVVGAVELNGVPVINYAAGTDQSTRRAVLIASLALGLFWDPADSPLGD